MSAASKKTIAMWLIVVVSVAAIVATSFYLDVQRGPALPQVDSAGMEPRVRERLEEYSESVRAEPGNSDHWARLAQAFHAHDLFAQAIEAYAQAMELQSNDWRWPYLAGLAQVKSDPQASLPFFGRAIDQHPGSAALYINFGDTLIRLGQHEEAEIAYRKALAIDAESSHALYGLAQVALITQDPQAALTSLLRAEAIAPNHGEIHSLLAQTHQRLGNDEAARRQSVLARAWSESTRAPDPVVQQMESLAVDAQSIVRRGIQLAKRGEYRTAEAAFREALVIRAGNARDYANLGGALAGQGRPEEALVAYRRGLEIDPEDVDILNNLGYTLLQLRRHDEAEQHLQKALEFDPGFDAALGNLGLLAQQQQQPELATRYFERALEQNPGLLFARKALASQLAIAGDTEGAAGHWRTVLEINPHELAAVYNLAMTMAARGDHAEAIAYLRQGLQIAPNSSRLVAALAWELATSPEDELRNGAEAVQLAQRVYSAFPDQPEMLDIMAAALAETGDFENAVKLMEQAVARGGVGAQPLAMRLKAYRQGKPWRHATSADVTASVLVPDL